MISKLPGLETTIFSVMSKLASENNAINLSQGFPDFKIDSELSELIYKAAKDGHNQYALMTGMKSLREGISKVIKEIYKKEVDPETEITITSGATEALYAAISAVVNPGDEVIMFDPAYDSYEPAVKLNLGKPVRIPLTFPDYKIDREKVLAAINQKTKLIIINTPNNPTGSLISKEDIEMLKEIVRKHDIYIISDEVYEHIVFDNEKHYSMLTDDELFKRSFVISSFGKTFHITGWKVGYCTAPVELTQEFRKIHQFLTFSTSTPSQFALSEYIKNIDRIKQLGNFYKMKRDLFLELIAGTGFKPLSCSGTYFQLLEYSDVSDENDFDFALRLTKEIKVASIPVSVFYKNKTDNKVLRFCFAKEDKTLKQAAELLKTVK